MTSFPDGPLLVLAPHPDDESLACGGLLAAAWAAGHPAHVLCLTDGAASHSGSASHPPARLAVLRRAELDAAVAALGGVPGRDVTALAHPDAALHRVQGPGADLTRDIRLTVRRTGARVLLAPSAADPHCDHVAAAEAAMRVAADAPNLVLTWYSVWARWTGGGTAPRAAGTERIAIDASAHVAAKRGAIRSHASQMGGVIRDDPHGFAMPPGFAEMFAETPELFDIPLRFGAAPWP